MSTEVATTITDLVKYGVTDETLRKMVEKYKDHDATLGDEAYVEVVAGIRVCRDMRGEIETKRKQAKAKIVRDGKIIDGEANRIKDVLFGIENPMKESKQSVDDEKERIEAERVTDLKLRLASITVEYTNGMSVEDIEARLSEIKAVPIDDTFQEFYHDAEQAKQRSLSTLAIALKTLQDAIDEKRQLAEQRAEQEEEQKRLDAQRKEQAEEKRKQDEKIAADIETQRQENARIETENRRLQSEKESLENEKRDREAADAEQRRTDAADEARRKRIEALAPDKTKLSKLADLVANIKMPKVHSSQAQAILSEAKGKLGLVAQQICDRIGEVS